MIQFEFIEYSEIFFDGTAVMSGELKVVNFRLST